MIFSSTLPAAHSQIHIHVVICKGALLPCLVLRAARLHTQAILGGVLGIADECMTVVSQDIWLFNDKQ